MKTASVRSFPFGPFGLRQKDCYNYDMVPGRLLWTLLILVFAAGVMCSVVCPERIEALAANDPKDGYCSECISTDFVGGSKISDELISLAATTTIPIELRVPSGTWLPAATPGSAAIPVIPAQPIFLLNRVLRS